MGLFQDIMEGNVDQLNNAYKRIREEHTDRYLGALMMSNDQKNNSQLLEETAQKMYCLFQKVDVNSRRKSEITSKLRLTSFDLKCSRQELQKHIEIAHDTFNTELFSYYQKAYQESLAGDPDSFRNAAMDYRLRSQEMALYLIATNAQSAQIGSYLALDLKQINYLWDLHQRKFPDQVRKTLIASLATQISFDNEMAIRAYIGSIDAIKRIIERNIR